MSDEIPEDIMKAASGIVTDICVKRGQMIGFRDMENEYLERAIASAVLTERERCWKIANQYACDHGMRHEHDSEGATVDETCGNICKEIRTGTYPFKPDPTPSEFERMMK